MRIFCLLLDHVDRGDLVAAIAVFQREIHFLPLGQSLGELRLGQRKGHGHGWPLQAGDGIVFQRDRGCFDIDRLNHARALGSLGLTERRGGVLAASVSF